MSESEVIPHSIAIVGQLTAAGFPRVCQHRIYGMSCTDFDTLEARAGGQCEICGATPSKLWIDHDHSAGDHGVRGLVCSKCNAHLRRVDNGEREADAATLRFIESAWHLTHSPKADPITRRAPLSAFRIPLDLKREVEELAKLDGTTLTETIIEGIEEYLRTK